MGAALARREPAGARAAVDERDRRRCVADEHAAGGADPLGAPARRDADRDERPVRDRGREPVRIGERRSSVHVDEPLHGQGCVREQAARVAAAAARVGARTHEPQRRGCRRGEPGSELQCGPVVLAAAEGHVDRPLPAALRSRDDRDLGRRALEQNRERVRHAVAIEAGRRVDEHQVGAVRRRQAHEISAAVVAREGRRAGRRPAGGEGREGGRELGLACDEARQHELAALR